MENLNSCCYVARINEIKKIEDAQNIEQVLIRGWNCITKKGEYNVNDLVVIATTDAIIPQKLSDGLGITNYLRKGQRVRTVKLRGVYSECLIIPITFIPVKYRTEGTDCMELLEIFKYEPPVKQVQLSSGKKIRYQSNPAFHVYYKFPNLKNVPGMFTETDLVQITRKLHGTNARFGIIKKIKLSFWDRVKKFLRLADEWIDYEFVVGSHNVEKGSDSQGYYDTNVWYEIADKYNIKKKLWDYIKVRSSIDPLETGVIIYGEIYGAGIQKNYNYGLNDIEFAMFDMTWNNHYDSTMLTEYVANNILKLPHVPVLYEGHWSQSIQDKFVFNNYIENSKVPHEGIVIKHISGERNKVAKIINPSYLTYSEKHDVGDSH